MTESGFQPLAEYREYPQTEMSERAREHLAEMRRRRTVRDFSDRPVPRPILEDCIRTAMTAPSGANMQPWYFAVVQDPATKKQIRQAAEEVERDFYAGRASDEWLEALAPLGTDENKPFLELAPYLVVIFAQLHGRGHDHEKVKHYYVNESVGIASGMLITAIHHAGLACLTHTPSPMRFLNQILERPANERPYLLLAVGYPARDARIPTLTRKRFEEVCQFT